MERTSEIKGCTTCPLRWFPVVTDRIVGLSLEVDRDLFPGTQGDWYSVGLGHTEGDTLNASMSALFREQFPVQSV